MKKMLFAKTYQFKSFNEAFGFMTRVAMKVGELNHHPDWCNFFHKVRTVYDSMYSQI